MSSSGPRRTGALAALGSLLVAALTLGFGGEAEPKPTVRVVKDVVYSVPEGGPLALDVYRPAEGWGYPSLLVIHGGAWKRGDKSDWRWAARKLAKGGFAVFVANYRLAPPRGDAIYPTPVGDIRTAYAWIQQNAPRYHGDPRSIGVVGSSAGGHLGLLMAAEMSGHPEAPRAVVGLSPPTDLSRLGTEGPLQRDVAAHLGCELRDCPDTYAVASPVNRVQGSDPATFLAYSEDELIPLEHGVDMSDRLTEAGVPNRLMVVEGTAHGLRMGNIVLRKAIRFLRRRL
ncbi:MAG: alpha/beta hydrolase [Actinomycetota bacterium]